MLLFKLNIISKKFTSFTFDFMSIVNYSFYAWKHSWSSFSGISKKTLSYTLRLSLRLVPLNGTFISGKRKMSHGGGDRSEKHRACRTW